MNKPNETKKGRRGKARSAFDLSVAFALYGYGVAFLAEVIILTAA